MTSPAKDAYDLWRTVAEAAESTVSGYRFSAYKHDVVLCRVRERFVKKVDTLRDASKLKGWTYRLVKSVCDREKEREEKSSHTEVQFDDERHIMPMSSYQNGETAIRILAKFEEELCKLKVSKQVVVRKVLFDGMKHREVAEEMGEERSTVTKAVGIVRGELKRAMRRRARWDAELRADWEELFGYDLVVGRGEE